MKQIESNLFSEGLNLDTNPIAMSNLLLSGALNATMITMNGNELILQNDMGNGRVESANLPAGYVPVGMLEYGGIVYIASYNPLTNQSLIGSFPSPERNISSKETNGNRQITFNAFSENGIIKTTVLKLQLTLDVLRPGDKFSIEMSDLNDFYKLMNAVYIDKTMKLDVCTMDSNGSLINITDSITASYDYVVPSRENVDKNVSSYVFYKKDGFIDDDIKFNVYKNKVVGELYLKLSLDVPDHIPYYICGNEIRGGKNYEIYFSNIIPHISKYSVSVNGGLAFDVYNGAPNVTKLGDVLIYHSPVFYKNEKNKFEPEIHKVSITPYFDGIQEENSGLLNSYTYLLDVDLNKIATGVVDIDEFRYYNNTDDGVFIFNYTISSYLKANQNIESIYLCTINKKDADALANTVNELTVDNEKIHERVIALGIKYGNLLDLIPYGEGLEIGEIYIGYLKIIINERSMFDAKAENTTSVQYSKPFIVITSSITNYLYTGGLKSYINGDLSNNPEIRGELTNLNLYDDYLAIPCKINWNVSLIEDNTNTIITLSDLIQDNPNDITCEFVKSGSCKFKLNPTIVPRIKNDSPFKDYSVEAKFDKLNLIDNPKLSYLIETKGTIDELNLLFGNGLITNEEKEIIGLSIADDNTITFNLDGIKSRAAINCKYIDTYRLSYAYVPYIGNDERNLLVFGWPLIKLNGTAGQEAAMFMAINIDGDTGSSNRKGGASQSYVSCVLLDPSNPDSPFDIENLPESPDKNTDDDDVITEQATTYMIRHKKPGMLTWKEIDKLYREFIKTGIAFNSSNGAYFNFETLSELPLIVFWLACDFVSRKGDNASAQFNNPLIDGNEESKLDYCFPLMLATNGKYYPLDNFGTASGKTTYSNGGFFYDPANFFKSDGYVNSLCQTMSFIYVPTSELVPYKILGYIPDQNKYIYTQDYSYDYEINVWGKTDIVIEGYEPDMYYSLDMSTHGTNTSIRISKNSSNGDVKLPKLTLIDEHNNLKYIDSVTLNCSIEAPSIEEAVLTFLAFGEDTLVQQYVLIDEHTSNKRPIMYDAKNNPLNPMYPYIRFNDKFYKPEDLLDIPESERGPWTDLFRIANYFNSDKLRLELYEDINKSYGIYLNANKLESVTCLTERDWYGSGRSNKRCLISKLEYPFQNILLVLPNNALSKLR